MMNAAPRRLPIDTVVKRSFLYAWESRAVLMTPLLIYAAVMILADIVLSGLGEAANGPVQFLFAAAEQVFATGFAVGVHRYVLAGEVRPGFGFFRWDRHFVRYILLTLFLLLLVVVAAVVVLGAVGFDPAKLDAATALIGSAVLFAVTVTVSRLSLLLPSAALGDDVPARTVWKSTERNGFRLLAATLLIAMPFVIVELMLTSLRGVGGLAFPVTILLGLITSVQLVVITVMLSLAYDVLVRGGGPQPS
jgi:hypothetical protein